MKYIPVSKPLPSDSCWYSNQNIYFLGGNGLPNCTCFCYGAWIKFGLSKPKLCPNQAELWYTYNDGYKRGNTPKLGSIICWSLGNPNTYKDGSGHVGIVNKINSDNSIVVGQSAYKGSLFYETTLYPPYNFGNYKFQGFIYYPVDFDNEVVINTNKQMKVIGGNLIFLNLNWQKDGTYPTGTIVDVVDDTIIKHFTQSYSYIKVSINGKVGYMCVDYLEKYEQPVISKPVIPTVEVIGTPVGRNSSIEQINITNNELFARSTPNGEKIGFIKPGIYNVYDKEYAGSYTWVKVESDKWVALNPKWNGILPKDEVQTTTNTNTPSSNKPESVSDGKSIVECLYKIFKFILGLFKKN